MKKSEIRETVFKVLFRYEFYDVETFRNQINIFFATYPGDIEEDKCPPLDDRAVTEITQKVIDIISKIDVVDKCIADNCEGWKFERIGKAELSILRIAVYEIMFENDLDNAVSISEAVILAKKYCDEKSYSFINGILAKIIR